MIPHVRSNIKNCDLSGKIGTHRVRVVKKTDTQCVHFEKEGMQCVYLS